MFLYAMEVFLATSEQQVKDACQVLNELRVQYSADELVKTVKKQMEKGYRLVSCTENGSCLGALGFVVSHKLAWKKHIYIDDLVVTEASRSRGAGNVLLEWIMNYARENGCEQVHLDSGVQRFAAHKFYLNNGFRIASHHFSRTEI